MFANLQSWWKGEEGMAAVEAALIVPVLLTMLLGTFDLGYGILAAQKTIRAAQVTADLVARNRVVDDPTINEAIEGGRLALSPFSLDSYGADVKSVRFDEDGNVVELWCRTLNTTPNGEALNNLEALNISGEGVVIVTARYNYTPIFSGFVFDTMTFEEIAFARGRLTPTVSHVSGEGC